MAAPINQRYPLEYPVCGKVSVVLVVTVVLVSVGAVVPGTGVTEVSGSVTGMEIVVPVSLGAVVFEIGSVVFATGAVDVVTIGCVPVT